MSSNDQYALNWNNHTSHIRKAFDSLLAGNDFVDVTLSCEGKKISGHKMLLSACSAYFYDLFRDNPCQHPIVILKDVKFQNLVDILKFMYNGEVSVAAENFDSFLKTAEMLQVCGLTEDEKQDIIENEDHRSSIINNETSVVKALSPSKVTDLKLESLFKNVSSKKRPFEVSRIDPNILLKKKKKKDEVTSQIDIKEELDDDDDINYNAVELHEGVSDPLEVSHSDDLIEEVDPLQSTGSSQFADVQEFLTVFAGNRQEENRCNICSKTFTHPLSLVQHRHVHTGSTVCPFCKVTFSRKYNLKTHIRNVHSDLINRTAKYCKPYLD